MNQYSDNNMSNFVVAMFGGLPAYVAAFVEQSFLHTAGAAFLTFVFFTIGKLIDVAIKMYLESRAQKRSQHDKKS